MNFEYSHVKEAYLHQKRYPPTILEATQQVDCPRCKSAKIEMGRNPWSPFTCLNPEKEVCGVDFYPEIRNIIERKEIEYWGKVFNPAWNYKNVSVLDGLISAGELIGKGIPIVLDEEYLFKTVKMEK